MSRNPLECVQKLIALALGGASEEEGRTAAVMAVRLIQQHGLLSPAVCCPPRAAPPRPNYSTYRTAPQPPPERWNGPIKSKWEKGRCEVCRQEVMKGNVVVWLGKRVRHETCHKLYSPKT